MTKLIKAITGSLMVFLFLICLCSGRQAFGKETTLKFDATSEMEGMKIKTTSYVKGAKIRMEMDMMGTRSIFVSDGKKAYMFTPSAGTAVSVPISNVYGQLPVNQDYKQVPGLKKIGEETLDGKACEVFEYSESGTKHKIWVSKDVDFPVKEEADTPKGKMVTYIDNIEKDIPLSDSMFSLPAGTNAMDAGDILNKLQGSVR